RAVRRVFFRRDPRGALRRPASVPQGDDGRDLLGRAARGPRSWTRCPRRTECSAPPTAREGRSGSSALDGGGPRRTRAVARIVAIGRAAGGGRTAPTAVSALARGRRGRVRRHRDGARP